MNVMDFIIFFLPADMKQWTWKWGKASSAASTIYLFPGLLQSDEFWLLESSSSSRDVPSDDIACDMTVSVGLRGSLMFIADVVVDVARMLVQVVDAINFCGSIGSIWNGAGKRTAKPENEL